MIKFPEPFSKWLNQFDISEESFYKNTTRQQFILLDPSSEQLIQQCFALYGHNVDCIILFLGKHQILERTKKLVNQEIVFPFAVKLFSAYSLSLNDFITIIDALSSCNPVSCYSTVFSQPPKFTLDFNRKNEITKWLCHIIDRLFDPNAKSKHSDSRKLYQPKIWDSKLDEISCSLAQQYFNQPDMGLEYYNSRIILSHVERDILLGQYVLIFERLLRRKRGFSFIELIIFCCLYTNTHHATIKTFNKTLTTTQDINRANTWFQNFSKSFFSSRLDQLLKQVMLNQLLEDAQFTSQRKIIAYQSKNLLPLKYKSRVDKGRACGKYAFDRSFNLTNNMQKTIIEHQKYCIQFFYIDMVLLVHLMQYGVIPSNPKFYINNETYDFTDMIKNYNKIPYLYTNLSQLGFHFKIPWKIFCMAWHINNQFQIILEQIKKEAVSLLEVLPEAQVSNTQNMFDFLKDLL